MRAGLFWVFGRGGGLSVAHNGAGCRSVPDGDITGATFGTISAVPAVNVDALWREGEKVDASQKRAIVVVLDDGNLAGTGTPAIVVVQNSRIVGERYGEGFSAATPLLGWSMIKTVIAMIIGTLVGGSKMSANKTALFELWKADKRAVVGLADLMAMSSGLEFNDDYSDDTNVTCMLYLEPKMTNFAEAKPLAADVGKKFSYSSSTTLLRSLLWQDAIADPAKSLAWPREKLFGPLDMTSAVLEADARGSFSGVLSLRQGA